MLEAVRSKDALRRQVGAMDHVQGARRAIINTKCRPNQMQMDRRTINHIQLGLCNHSLLFMSNPCKSTHHTMHKKEVSSVATSQCAVRGSLAINLIANHLCKTILRLGVTMRQIHLQKTGCHHELIPPMPSSPLAGNRFPQIRELFRLLKRLHTLPNHSPKLPPPPSPTSTTRRSHGVRDHQENAHSRPMQHLSRQPRLFKSHTARGHQQLALKIHRSLSNPNLLLELQLYLPFLHRRLHLHL